MKNKTPLPFSLKLASDLLRSLRGRIKLLVEKDGKKDKLIEKLTHQIIKNREEIQSLKESLRYIQRESENTSRKADFVQTHYSKLVTKKDGTN